jgi:hypothetical protein
VALPCLFFCELLLSDFCSFSLLTKAKLKRLLRLVAVEVADGIGLRRGTSLTDKVQ